MKKSRVVGGLITLSVVVTALAAVSGAGAFNGPSNNGGIGYGAIGLDSASNMSVGSGTIAAGTKFSIYGSTTNNTAYALKVLQSNGGPIIYARNDGVVSIGTTTVSATNTLYVASNIYVGGTISGNYQGLVSAGNVTGGVFNSSSANFAFPGNLGINTSSQVGLPNALSVYGSTTITGVVYAGGGYYDNGNQGVDRSCNGNQYLATTTVSGGIITGGTCVNLGAGGGGSIATSSLIIGNYTKFTGTSTIGASLVYETGTTVSLSSTAGLAVGTTTSQSAGNGMFVGNIGIGASPSTARLVVAGNGTGVTLIGDIYGSGNYAGISLNGSTGAGNYNFLSSAADSALYINRPTGNNIVFAMNNSTQMILTSNGYLGIGTTTPSTYLSVGNATSATVAVFGGGSGKITAGTVDPVYTIDGKTYATYLPGMVGVKEEVTGIMELGPVPGRVGVYSKSIDFAALPAGSDLWLFAKATVLKKNFGRMAVLLTPEFDGRVWYEKNAADSVLTIYGRPAEATDVPTVSYRLTAPRFDEASWPNTAPASEGSGLVVPKDQ